MLTKRIIPCLDIKDGRTVKGVNFINLRDAGHPVELAVQYAAQGADELVFLDITATNDNRKTLVGLVRDIARHLNIPFTVGGGIGSVADASALLDAGADKVAINSSAVRNPQLINDLAREFGSQFVVVAIDSRQTHADEALAAGHMVHTHGGKQPTGLHTQLWAQEVWRRGAGEILLTSMNTDGVKQGFDIGITAAVSQMVNIPVIASGGAGSMAHFAQVFRQTNAAAALAASIFHFGEIAIPHLKDYLYAEKIPIRL
ncbi:MAG: imidazole glycerol phosphate synthase subunit HisF [Bacteroidetes bacterium]|nr:MAG: imidazole glycerol phosphate synthase subunit HisF [Bacteroidota bacterium]